MNFIVPSIIIETSDVVFNVGYFPINVELQYENNHYRNEIDDSNHETETADPHRFLILLRKMLRKIQIIPRTLLVYPSQCAR